MGPASRRCDRCLAPARGGVDGPALSALCMKPDPQAADVLLENLTRLREMALEDDLLSAGYAILRCVQKIAARLNEGEVGIGD